MTSLYLLYFGFPPRLLYSLLGAFHDIGSFSSMEEIIQQLVDISLTWEGMNMEPIPHYGLPAVRGIRDYLQELIQRGKELQTD